jgi:hypothetical protein
MDALATIVLGALVPYLVKVGQSVAKDAGEVVGTKIEELYNVLKARFQGKPAAEEALADLEAKPTDEDAQTALRLQLKKQMNADESLAEELRKLVNDIKQDKETYSFLTQVYGGKVDDIFNIGKVDTLNIN